MKHVGENSQVHAIIVNLRVIATKRYQLVLGLIHLIVAYLTGSSLAFSVYMQYFDKLHNTKIIMKITLIFIFIFFKKITVHCSMPVSSGELLC